MQRRQPARPSLARPRRCRCHWSTHNLGGVPKACLGTGPIAQKNPKPCPSLTIVWVCYNIGHNQNAYIGSANRGRGTGGCGEAHQCTRMPGVRTACGAGRAMPLSTKGGRQTRKRVRCAHARCGGRRRAHKVRLAVRLGACWQGARRASGRRAAPSQAGGFSSRALWPFWSWGFQVHAL